MKKSWLSVILLTLAIAPASVFSIDSVIRRGAERPVGGEIKSISKTEIVVFQKVGNKEEKIPANEVLAVDWDGEPAGFGLGRGHEEAGNYAEALKQFNESLSNLKPNSDNIKTDIEFYIARTMARMAIADPTHAAEASTKLKAFVGSNRDSFRLYEAQALLAEVALRSNDAPAADASFNSLTQAPWPETQMLGKIGLARVLLAGNNVDGAKAGFDEVAASASTNPLELSRKLQAMLGQVRCLQLGMKHAEAVALLDQIIEQADAEDKRTLAEAYLRQGDSLAALGENPKDAVLAYLHVDVIPALAGESDLHAEALFQLSKLWGTIGQASRGAEASEKLKQLYPNSDWAKKISAGS